MCSLLVPKRGPYFKKHHPLHHHYTGSMWLSGKEYTCNAGYVGLIPGSGGTPGEMATHPGIFLPGKSHGQRSLVGYSPWSYNELDTT